MAKFTFWKNNQKDQEFQLTDKELKHKFTKWTEENWEMWVNYPKSRSLNIFLLEIGSFENDDWDLIFDVCCT